MFGLDAGFSVPIRGIAAPGRDVVVMDYQGLLRWDGDRFTRLWQDPEPDTVFAESVVGVTADEVWVSGSPSESAASNLYRNRGEAWDTIGPAQSCDVANYSAEGLGSGPAAVAATDGAIWAGTNQGLARMRRGGLPGGHEFGPVPPVRRSGRGRVGPGRRRGGPDRAGRSEGADPTSGWHGRVPMGCGSGACGVDQLTGPRPGEG